MKARSSRRGWSCMRRREATTGASGASDAKMTSLCVCVCDGCLCVCDGCWVFVGGWVGGGVTGGERGGGAYSRRCMGMYVMVWCCMVTTTPSTKLKTTDTHTYKKGKQSRAKQKNNNTDLVLLPADAAGLAALRLDGDGEEAAGVVVEAQGRVGPVEDVGVGVCGWILFWRCGVVE
jgi:hypothetical protein